jgi:hypothetical protein
MSAARRFIGEPIQVELYGQPLLTKKAGCPAAFHWRGDIFAVTETVSEWHDYSRRGRMALNMTPEHAQAASRRGSRGVGRDFFTVRTDRGRTFILYYDRAPKSSSKKEGGWFLFEEVLETERK